MRKTGTIITGLVAGVLMVGASIASAAITNPEGFEGYSTGAWSPSEPVEGWTVNTLAGSPTFDIDPVDGFSGTQGFRVHANSTGAIGQAVWHNSADIGLFPKQTMHVEWQGILKRTNDDFGRLIFNSASNFVEMRSDSGIVYFRYDSDPGAGATAADFAVPQDAVSFSWPLSTSVTLWYAIEIDSDYDTNKTRARFGIRDAGSGDYTWNSYTPWLDMFNTLQQTDIVMNVDGRIHFDNLSLTAEAAEVPEPATVGFFGMGCLIVASSRRRR